MPTVVQSGQGDRKRIPEWDIFCNPGAKYTTGVAEDLEQFIYSVFYIFDEEHEPRFTIFSKKWKESNLGLILCGRCSFRETYELTDYIFQKLKQYAKSKLDNKQNNILIRYAAIYSLYAFFFKQPCRPKVRIKLSYEEFVDLEGLIEEAKKDSHYDVLYAWSKLICCHGFQYSVVGGNYGLEVAKRLDKKEGTESLLTYSASSYLKSKDFRGVIRKLSKAHNNYTKMKESYMQTNTDIMISLTSTSEIIIEEIEEIASEELKPVTQNETIVLKGPSDIGDKRKKLKERFFGGETDSHNPGSKIAYSQKLVADTSTEDSNDQNSDTQVTTAATASGSRTAKRSRRRRKDSDDKKEKPKQKAIRGRRIKKL